MVNLHRCLKELLLMHQRGERLINAAPAFTVPGFYRTCGGAGSLPVKRRRGGDWGIWCEVQKVQPGKALEIAIERHQAAVAAHSESGKVSIGPEPMGKTRRTGQSAVGVIKLRRLRLPADDGQCQKLPIDDPGFMRAKWVW